MNIFLICAEIIGTIAFAVSGAVTAMRRDMDLFGVCILGITTAVGGGIIRDIILGMFPVSAFVQPLYVAVAFFTSLFVFLPFMQKLLFRNARSVETILLLADSAGLAVFTAYGYKVAVEGGFSDNIFLCVFVAVVTGVGGGVMRDLFAGQRPYIFVKHIYAVASLGGALLCALLYPHIGMDFSILFCFLFVFIVRILSAVFHLKLPRAHINTGK